MKLLKVTAVSLIALLTFCGCSSTGVHTVKTAQTSGGRAGVDQNHYVVRRGDTLFSIAFANGLDYRTLALINKLDPANAVIHPGDVLLVRIKNLNVKNVYRVKSGDTLYSVARRHGRSVADLARINHIAPPYDINAGQLLILDDKKPTFSPASQKPAASKPSGSAVASSRPSGASSVTETRPQPVPTQKGAYNSRSKLSWQWPTYGTVVKRFASGRNSGISISGRKGQNIKAAAEGKVVYAGNALRGYGNLIIIKHNDDYLSAYAHNDRLLVKELDVVKQGDVIARMGDTDSDRVNLHFEIRYRGQSVNPQTYLPKR